MSLVAAHDSIANEFATSSNQTLSVTGAVAGNTLVVAVNSDFNGDPTLTVVTSNGTPSSFTQISQVSDISGYACEVELWILPNCAAGSHTITIGSLSGSMYVTAAVAEFDDLPSSLTTDQSTGSGTAAGTTIATGDVDLGDTGALWANMSHTYYSAGASPNITSSIFTVGQEVYQNELVDAMPMSFVYKGAQSAGTYNNTFTIANSAPARAAAMMSAEEDAGGGGGRIMSSLTGNGGGLAGHGGLAGQHGGLAG